MRTGVLIISVLAVVGTAVPARAQVTPDPAFQVEAQRSFLRAQQRGIDQATNPEFLRRYAPWVQEYMTIEREDPHRMSDVDPFRHDWAPARGREHDVQLENRYGARMDGQLFLPRGDRKAPFPLVILLPGGNGNEQQYRGITQTLAENGYAALGVGVQGDYGSEIKGDPAFCEPGAWQEPQEMGIREQGACAGEDPAVEEPDGTLGIAELLISRTAPEEGLAGYEDVKARKTFGALDWLRWATAPDNPYRRWIDPERVGLVGHSLGAHGALLAGNGDPLERVDAVVSLDGFGRMNGTVSPRVPTMFQHAEGNELGGPARERPQPESLPGHRDARLFQKAGVPTMAVTLGGSAHNDFQWIPLHVVPVALNASRDGERVSVHYTLAWLDRWLKPDRKSRDAATRRLLTARYGDRVDGASIGQGRFDGKNRPPTIAGETARHHLSTFFTSWADFPGGACADVRAGC